MIAASMSSTSRSASDDEADDEIWPKTSTAPFPPLALSCNSGLSTDAPGALGDSPAPPLATIRSLAYFLPVIEEVLSLRVSPGYFQHLRHKIEHLAQAR